MLSHKTPTTDAHAAKLTRPRYAPNLVVIGAMKASTTTFYELITRHPDIWFPSEKEPHYFSSPDYGEPTAWQRYLKLFESAPKSAKYIGEASTGYSKLPHFGNTARRLQETLDDPRFIYLVRDPVERTISNFQHSYMSGHYAGGNTLAEAIENDPILVDASCYARQIFAYLDVFGPERLHVIPTRELHIHTDVAMRRVEKFLELPPHDGWDVTLPQSNSKQALGGSLAVRSFLPDSVVNVGRKLLPSQIRNRLKSVAASAPKLPEITEAERQLVFDKIKDDLQDLVKLLGDRISAWPSVQKLGKG